tara:strand:- start:173115 stop:173726 length:612 start_codon:yes stop_codon:yes gene_type:complete
MKTLKYTVVILCIAILSISCGTETKKLKNELKNSKEIIKNASKVAKEGENLQNTMLDLKSKTPLTKAQFEAWLPETLIELPKTSSSINLIPGVGSCGASYNVLNKRIRVMIIDGAGAKGAGAVGPYMMSSKMDYDLEESWGTTKSKTINGIKVKETYQKNNDEYTLSMFYNNRFAVDIEVAEVTYAELEQLVKELNLEGLTGS